MVAADRDDSDRAGFALTNVDPALKLKLELRTVNNMMDILGVGWEQWEG